MAKKSKKNEKFNYNASVNALKAEGPAGLYLIWGPEDYLADRFFEEIKKPVSYTHLTLPTTSRV